MTFLHDGCIVPVSKDDQRETVVHIPPQFTNLQQQATSIGHLLTTKNLKFNIKLLNVLIPFTMLAGNLLTI
jgi:hypothetical protein